MVEAEAITRSFGGVKALDQVSLAVRPGEVFGLLGPNGAGKTTLVRVLTGVLRPDGGRAWVAGLDVGREPHRVKARIGYATQEQSVYRDLTVEENLLFRARLYRPKEARGLAKEALARFGLLPYANRLAGHLSGGWRQ
ncbi:ABC transporter ATP-binding protein, partial [Shewanella sp. C31]|nr:ABC transporter ATP-binding protein [Shewanella electrica]